MPATFPAPWQVRRFSTLREFLYKENYTFFIFPSSHKPEFRLAGGEPAVAIEEDGSLGMTEQPEGRSLGPWGPRGAGGADPSLPCPRPSTTMGHHIRK